MKRILLLVFVLSLALAGCQSSADEKTLDVTLSDYKITPDKLTTQAGSQITVSVTNNGTVKHNLTVMKLGTDAGDSFGSDDLVNVLWKTEVQPGETRSATFNVPDEPGTYQVVCSMPGHMQAGMIGTLEVVK